MKPAVARPFELRIPASHTRSADVPASAIACCRPRTIRAPLLNIKVAQEASRIQVVRVLQHLGQALGVKLLPGEVRIDPLVDIKARNDTSPGPQCLAVDIELVALVIGGVGFLTQGLLVPTVIGAAEFVVLLGKNDVRNRQRLRI